MVLTDDLLNGVASRAQDEIGSSFTHGAVGNGASGQDSSSDSLGNELVRDARQEIDEDSVSGGSTATTVSLFINSTQANSQIVNELGFFDSSSGGEMQSINTFQDISKTSQIELFFDLELTVEVSQ
jgi:hypothetical protein